MLVRPFHRRRFAAAATLATVAVALAGCGGSTSSSSGGKQTLAPSQDAALHNELPAAIKSAGVVHVATDASYAPNEFFASDNTTIQGMDVDLGQALGDVLGVKFEFQNVSFDSILPNLSTRYDLGMSSFTDTKAREKVVDMVTYFSAGTSFMVRKDSTLDPSSVADLCGKTVGVEKGTTQLDDVTAQAKKCSLKIQAFPDQNGANLALSSGRVDVVLADSPVNAYAAKQSNGQFKIVGKVYGTAPYGIAVPKGGKYQGFSTAILDALKKVMANGTYTQILNKWGIASGAISNPVINGATS